MKERKIRAFSCDWGPRVKCDSHRGGDVTRFRQRVSQLHISVSLSFFCGFPLSLGLRCAEGAESGRTIAPPYYSLTRFQNVL